jgi:hypothetical protein
VIHILDVLVVAPGHLDDVRRLADDDYRPLMAEFDMQLVHRWIAPGVELADRPIELLLLWELPDVPSFWKMRSTAARDPRVMAFWEALTPMIETRERKLMCNPDDRTVLR